MNSKNFLLIAIVLIFVMYVPIKINQISVEKSNKVKVEYDEVVAIASSDAVKQLVYAADSYSNENLAEGKKIDYRDMNLNLDKALDRFYRTLFLNLNIEEDYSLQQGIKFRIPIKIATAYDGYYIDYFKKDGQGEQWSELKPYSMVDEKNNLIINFTLDDYVYIKDLSTNVVSEGRRKEFELKYPESCLKDGKTFNNVKGQVINNMIKNDLEYYTYYSNDIAKMNNWQLSYDIPYWGNRAIDSIAFMAFYQGEMFVGSDKVYNSYGFGSTKTVNKKDIYGYKKRGRKMYSTTIDGDEPTYFSNEYEAAIDGYEPDLEFYGK